MGCLRLTYHSSVDLQIVRSFSCMTSVKSVSGSRKGKEARFFDAETGRFLSLDPLSKEFPSWSAYNYCMGNPLSLVDKDGKAPQFAGGGDPPVAKVPTGVASASIGVNKRVKELAKTNDVPLPKSAPKPAAPTNSNQWQSDFAQWNKEYNQKIWDNATPEQKSYSNTVQNILQPLRDASIELAKPVAQLYTIQASMGGSGMATGIPLGTITQGTGSLPSHVAGTFRFSQYSEITLDKPIVLSRYYDNVNAFAKGRYMTNSISGFKFGDRMGLALRPSWNEMTKVANWEIPAGSTIYHGSAATQFPWFGGKTQYFVPELSNIKRVIK